MPISRNVRRSMDEGGWIRRMFGPLEGGANGVGRYRNTLWGHERRWAEVTLSAALWVLVEMLRVRTVYMHTPESGEILKNIFGTWPPRSLYSDLPRRFCFTRTSQRPRMVSGNRMERKTKRPWRMWRLQV